MRAAREYVIGGYYKTAAKLTLDAEPGLDSIRNLQLIAYPAQKLFFADAVARDYSRVGHRVREAHLLKQRGRDLGIENYL
jgi:hypothetical protein